MNLLGYDVYCIEPSQDSCDFISEQLRLPCSNRFKPEVHKDFKVITMVHVLEHIQDPEAFLLESKKALVPNGTLFIEVPDSVEFEYLPKDDDEFNSLHLHFFDVANLYNLVERCGFNITDIHRAHYSERNLRRILLLAQKT
jgi:SAM-dependent methyltransferase